MNPNPAFNLVAYTALIESMCAILGIGVELGQDYDSRYSADPEAERLKRHPCYLMPRPIPPWERRYG